MKTRSVLVRYPGYPYEFESLLPDWVSASIAGELVDAGHTTCIRDYGVVEHIERVFDCPQRGELGALGDALLSRTPLDPLSLVTTLWRLRRMDRVFEERHIQFGRELAYELAHTPDVDFVVFMLERPSDLAGTVAVAERLRSFNPDIPIIGAGFFADGDAVRLMEAYPVFDCCCRFEAEKTLPILADCILERDRWRSIENLVIRANGVVIETPMRLSESRRHQSRISYAPDLYPALRNSTKLRLFTIDDSRTVTTQGAESASEMDVRVRANEEIYQFIRSIQAAYGTTAFHFSGGWSPLKQINSLAYGLLCRGIRAIYSRLGYISETSPDSFSIWSASGCEAVSFQLDTGSQRLLEDYYGHSFGVSEAERALRTCRMADITTIAGFTYPCPEDDYHTRAETIRLIARTMPHAVQIRFPWTGSELAWFRRRAKSRFGLDWGWGSGQEAGHRGFVPRQYAECLSGRVSGRLPSDVVREHESLMNELHERTIATGLSAQSALMAALCGYKGREHEFSELLRRLFLAGDAPRLAGLVEQFNAAAAVSAHTTSAQTFGWMRAAVGN